MVMDSPDRTNSVIDYLSCQQLPPVEWRSHSQDVQIISNHFLRTKRDLLPYRPQLIMLSVFLYFEVNTVSLQGDSFSMVPLGCITAKCSQRTIRCDSHIQTSNTGPCKSVRQMLRFIYLSVCLYIYIDIYPSLSLSIYIYKSLDFTFIRC